MGQISAIALAITDLFSVVTKVVALFQEAKRNGWIKDGQSLRSAISAATTNEDRERLAQDLFNHEPK